ncbi:unnamed protein product, partial [Echinostoma caproni]|uniref:Fruitless n=1 Tax=Echinostoma caproni TaxID=27848 RepID=A0A183A283_9TREM
REILPDAQFLPVTDSNEGIEPGYRTGNVYPSDPLGVGKNTQLDDEDIQDEDDDEIDRDDEEVEEEDDEGEEWLPGPSPDSPGSVAALGSTRPGGLPSHMSYPMRITPTGPGNIATGGSAISKQESQQPDAKLTPRGGNDLLLKKVSC